MSISTEQLEIILARLLKAQQSGSSASNESTIASLNSRLPVFSYEPDRDDTFSAYYDRYGKIIAEDGGKLTDGERVRLLVGKLDKAEYTRFSDSMKPDGPYDKDYDTTVGRLQALFAPVRSLVMKRYEFFSLSRTQGSDLIEFSTRLNASCELANPPLKADQLKCLRFISNLHDYPDLRSRLIQFLEQRETEKKEPTFDEFMAEVRKYISVKASAAQFEQSTPVPSYAVTTDGRNALQKKQQRNTTNSHSGARDNSISSTNSETPRGQCYGCGGPHWRSECKHRNSKCNTCGAVGHIAKAARSSPRYSAQRSDSTKDSDKETILVLEQFHCKPT